MACACKVTEQINAITKEYGDKKSSKKISPLAAVENTFAVLLVLPLIPLIFIHVVISAIKGTPVHLDKVGNFGRNGRKQQLI